MRRLRLVEAIRSAIAESTARSASTATGRNAAPTSVSATPRVLRRNNVAPVWCSSALMAVDSAGWVMNSFSAARRKLSFFAKLGEEAQLAQGDPVVVAARG